MSSRCLFLEGPSKVGKSTILLTELQPYVEQVGGFMVQRLWQQDQLQAFCLREVAGSLWPVNAQYQGDEQYVFIDGTSGEWCSHPEVFVQMAARLPVLTAGKKFVLLDEIGGVELLCEPFFVQLERLLTGTQPCVGVFKSASNSKMMRENVAIAGSYQKRYKQLLTALSGQLISVNHDNLAVVRGRVRSFLKENI